MSNSIHKNHRKRLRDRALKNQLDSFSDFELMELLLYYSIPRVDTNSLAHMLLESCGSVKGVVEANMDSLCQIKGIGANSALLIRAVVELMRRYDRDCVQKPTTYNSLSKIASYLHRFFIGLDHERLYMLMFNNRMTLIDCVLLAEGSVNFTTVALRLILEKTMAKNAASIVLAHNHPNGLRIPSSADVEFTETVYKHLNELGIVLLEHLVFVDYEYQPIMLEQHGAFRRSPISNLVETGFYERFYDVDKDHYMIPPLFSPLEKTTEN